jgi:hypothetical protein
MNEQDGSGDEGSSSGPQAESLIAPLNSSQQQQRRSQFQVPFPENSYETGLGRESRQVPPTSVEAKVCIQGKCTMITKHK